MVEEREAPEAMETERTPERKRSESEGARKRKGPGAGDGQNEEPDAETDWEQESLQSAQVEEGGEHLLGVLKSWLQSEECGGLSISQCGALLAVAAFRSGTPLGSYLSRALVPGSSSGQRNRRQRSLLPLPLWDDSVTELKKLQEEGEFRRLAGSWAEKKMSKDKAGRLSRKVGLLVWHGLTVTVLNFLWTGGGGKGEVAAGPPGKAQSQALDRIWELVKVFVDDNSESTSKVPRSPEMGEWGKKLGDVRVSYHGEVVEKAQRLTLDQILPGLPPMGYGASVALAELCEGEVREKLENPLGTLLPEDELPDDVPAPKVHASQEQWEKIAGELYRRGLVQPVEDPVKVKGQAILNGAFGVPKPGKFLEDERAILRLIMDFRAVNSVTEIVAGDVRSLAGAPSLQHVVLPAGKVIRMSADDLVAAFYLFRLPAEWSRLMCFASKVAWRCLGIDRDGAVYVGATVLPMGWSSAVGILQHAHRRLALRSPLAGGGGLLGPTEIRRDSIFPDLELEEVMWSLYIDDVNIMEVMDAKIAKEMEGKSSEEQERLRLAYQHWGIPISKEKALIRASKAEKLGAVVDGDRGDLRCSTKRALDSLSLGFWLLRQPQVPRKALQVFLGREVHSLQFRRPLFGIFDYLWKEVGDGAPMLELGVKSVEEVLLAGMSQALRVTDLRAGLNEVVTASDASEHGGGMVYGARLTSQGLKEVYTTEEGLEEVPSVDLSFDEKQVILVFDFFAGIGGLSRALQLAKVPVNRLVVVEQNPECRRLNLTRWPGCDIVVDIEKLTRKDIGRMMHSVPGITGVIAGGGSPCQGLSKLSVHRQHLEDPRSKLFYKFADVLGWIGETAASMEICFLGMLENVVGDEEDITEMSRVLEARPIKVCSSGLSWVRRPRLYWASTELEDHPSFTRGHHELYEEVVFEEGPEPLEHVPDEGWKWLAAVENEEARLPTFTRAIPRAKGRPPPSPAGIASCDGPTIERWKADRMKYPPYTYKEEYLFQHEGTKELRVASVNERERLMGYPTGYTLGMFKTEARDEREADRQVVAREAALGNSFHAVTVACLIDLWLWSLQVRTDPLTPKVILKDWHESMGVTEIKEYGELDVEGSQAMPLSEGDEQSLHEEFEKRSPRRAKWLRLAGHSTRGRAKAQTLNVRLIHQYLRRMEFRGSDVRLDLQVVYRPDAVLRTSVSPNRWIWKVGQAYKWQRAEHINLLELRAILRTLQWRARSAAFHSCRFLHLSDSQICLAVLTKGRSSSRKINRILRKIAALCVALNLYPLWAWIASRLNPADGPSRKYAPKD